MNECGLACAAALCLLGTSLYISYSNAQLAMPGPSMLGRLVPWPYNALTNLASLSLGCPLHLTTIDNIITCNVCITCNLQFGVDTVVCYYNIITLK